MMEKTLGPEHPNVARTLVNLAQLQITDHHHAEAEALYLRALAIQEKSLGADHPILADTLKAYALLLRETKRKPEAAVLNTRAKDILAKLAAQSTNQPVDVRELESAGEAWKERK
jgi:hypothetical protein